MDNAQDSKCTNQRCALTIPRCSGKREREVIHVFGRRVERGISVRRSLMSNLGQAQFPPMTRPMRAMRLLPQYSRLRLSPTVDHSDQTSDSDAHGGGQGDYWASHKERASKVDPQVSDRISLLQIVDRDRDQRPA